MEYYLGIYKNCLEKYINPLAIKLKMKVILYTSPHCKWSKIAREFLKGKKIEFTEKDIVDDVERHHNRFREEMVDKTGQLATPVFDIEGLLLIGFNKKEVEETLEKAKNHKNA